MVHVSKHNTVYSGSEGMDSLTGLQVSLCLEESGDTFTLRADS